MLRPFKLCLFGAAISLFLALGAGVVDRSRVNMWIGGTNLDIDFLVTDADSGRPIKDASVHVRPDDGPAFAPFELRTDHDGKVRRECPNTLWTGQESRLRFTDTCNVRLPGWEFRASAAGYVTSAWTNLNEHYYRKAERAGPGRHALVVRLQLHQAAQQ